MYEKFSTSFFKLVDLLIWVLISRINDINNKYYDAWKYCDGSETFWQTDLKARENNIL